MMTTTDETTVDDMLAGEHAPVFAALCEELGHPKTYAGKAHEEYMLERQITSQGNMPRPKPHPPAGKNGVAKYTTQSS